MIISCDYETRTIAVIRHHIPHLHSIHHLHILHLDPHNDISLLIRHLTLHSHHLYYRNYHLMNWDRHWVNCL